MLEDTKGGKKKQKPLHQYTPECKEGGSLYETMLPNEVSRSFWTSNFSSGTPHTQSLLLEIRACKSWTLNPTSVFLHTLSMKIRVENWQFIAMPKFLFKVVDKNVTWIDEKERNRHGTVRLTNGRADYRAQIWNFKPNNQRYMWRHRGPRFTRLIQLAFHDCLKWGLDWVLLRVAGTMKIWR